jgi:hypothetical protein
MADGSRLTAFGSNSRTDPAPSSARAFFVVARRTSGPRRNTRADGRRQANLQTDALGLDWIRPVEALSRMGFLHPERGRGGLLDQRRTMKSEPMDISHLDRAIYEYHEAVSDEG